MMKKIRNINSETFIKAGREKMAVSISFFNSGNYLTSLNNLLTLRTLNILVIYGMEFNDPAELPKNRINISRIDVKTTKKSN